MRVCIYGLSMRKLNKLNIDLSDEVNDSVELLLVLFQGFITVCDERYAKLNHY